MPRPLSSSCTSRTSCSEALPNPTVEVASIQPSPVVTLNRAVAVSKSQGPQAALDLIEPLAQKLSNYFHFFGVKGGLLMQLGRNAEAQEAFCRAISLANTAAEAAASERARPFGTSPGSMT